MVEAVNGLWEWGGRTVSPHPHAHSTTVDFIMAKETTAISPARILLSPRLCKSTPALSIFYFRRPPELLFILSQEQKWLTFTHFWLRSLSPLSIRCSPAQDFPGFYPCSFSLRIYMTVAVSFPHGRICGSCVVVSLTYKLGEL